MLRIGLTGGIASGKSTVARLLQEQGAVIIDADRLAREAVLPGTPAWQALKQRFGDAFFHPDGTLDRIKLGEHVFQDALAREDLNRIVHPAVAALLQRRLVELAEQERERGLQWLAVLDIPLLYEAGLEGTVSEVWVAYCPEPIQLQRLMARDGLTLEQALARIQSQMPLKEKALRAKRVINTDVPLEQLEAQLRDLARHYRWDPLPA